jgi:hypothetical protein
VIVLGEAHFMRSRQSLPTTLLARANEVIE